MPLDQEFCDSPYRFMQKHIVRVNISNQFIKPVGKYVHAFVVENPYGSQIANCTNGGKVCDLHLVEDPGAPLAPPNTRKVYWCHYDKDEIHHVTLGSSHGYMFTPRMDGCSLGIGAGSSDGSVRVAHSNAVSFAAQNNIADGPNSVLKAQAHRQISMLDQQFQAGNRTLASLVSPFSYMRDNAALDFGIKATTFGRRTNGTWKFYSHTYRSQGGQFIHGGVQDYVRKL